MEHSPNCYVVVTPVRDEERLLPRTIASMAAQTILPIEWVIVDDGSRDRTAEIVDQCAREYSWIRAVHRQDRGFRKVGAGIIEAFYAGFHATTCPEWQFLAKLDGDLSFAPNYFEAMLKHFQENPKLGIGGGVLYHVENGRRVPEITPAFHVRGGAKIYRRACWEAIDGLWVGPGSDTVDDVKANMLGWNTRSFQDQEMEHHRPTGDTYRGWKGHVYNGQTDYISGYHPLFLLAKSLARLARPPYVIGSIGHVYGYISGFAKNLPQVNDQAVIQYLRRQQLARLTGQETIWK